MPATSPIIELKQISKVFLTEEVETHALKDITFHIDQGEYVSIEGPSGSGKSTLLAILGLLDGCSSGHYRLNGQDVSSLPARRRAAVRNSQIGFVFQSFNLIGDMTVQENVELPLMYRSLSTRERRQRVAESLERVGMSHRLKHYPAQLSGGQQQRVAVARAVVGQPAILLADEPTGNLDSKSGDAVMGLLAELHRQGSTLCVVTHDRRYVSYAQRSVRLMDGQIAGAEEAIAAVAGQEVR